MPEQIYYLAGGLAAVAGIIFGAYKLGPDRNRIIVESAEVSVRLAGQTRDDLAEDVASLRAELAERKREEAQYRSDVNDRLAELSAQLRAEKAEKQAVKAENDRLRQRVATLEAEVARLKSGTP